MILLDELDSLRISVGICLFVKFLAKLMKDETSS